MHALPLSHSTTSFVEDLEYSEAALAADPETATLAEPHRRAIGEGELLLGRERAARREVQRSEAVLAVRNSTLDRLTMLVGGSALAESGMNRQALPYRRLFAVPPSEFVRQPLRRQGEQTLNLLLPAAEALAEGSPTRTLAPALRSGAEAALAALEQRTRAKAARSLFVAELEEWKEGVNRLRLGVYSDLLKLAAARGFARSWADTFFPGPAASGAGDSDAGSSSAVGVPQQDGGATAGA